MKRVIFNLLVFLYILLYNLSICSCFYTNNRTRMEDIYGKYINFSLEKTTQKTTQKLNHNQLKIIEIIKENPKITKKELANILGITQDGVKYNLKKLVDKNIVERIGPDNGGYWQVQ